MNADIIIIGGGLGGLTTGALLAKEGLRVIVLEKNAVIGGGLQTFRRGNIEFETGMHILGGFRKGGTLHRICTYLGIIDRLRLRDMDEWCMDEITYGEDNVTYRIASGRQAFAESLAVYFPKQREQLHNYVEALYKLTDEIDIFHLRPAPENIVSHSEQFLWPVDKFIAHYVTDPKLRDLLAYMNPMYGGIEGHTPAYIHALINVLYIEGPSRFEGGSLQMALALQSVIEQAGGRVIANAPVEHIEVREKAVQKVVTHDRTEYQADRYIAAIHPSELFRITDENAFPRAYRNRLESLPNTYSTFNLFIELHEGAFPYINHTCYYERDYRHIWRLGEYVEGQWPVGFMFMTPTSACQGPFATHMIINSIMPYEAVAQWENTLTGRRGADYEAWKKARQEDIIRLMELRYPDFRRAIKHIYTATPLTVRDYFHTKHGSLYGYEKDCENFLRSQVPIFTKVSNLLLTGQNIGLHGICGVPLSAINTAEAIVGVNQIIRKM